MPDDSIELARSVRADCLKMVHRARASHLGGCLSAADILAVLYGGVLRVDPKRPDWPQRDRLLVSKGHCAAALYSALARSGFFPLERLQDYCRDGSPMAGHISHKAAPGVEVSTGSLGHGLSLACGMALGAKSSGEPNRVFALLSDGECDEGSTWEAFLFAPQHRLDNLVAVVDYNKIQSFGSVREVLDLEPLADKLRAFRWEVREIDGHDHEAIRQAVGASGRAGKPVAVVAHTVKGKGVSFMEGKLAWHYKSPSDEELAKALAELEARP